MEHTTNKEPLSAPQAIVRGAIIIAIAVLIGAFMIVKTLKKDGGSVVAGTGQTAALADASLVRMNGAPLLGDSASTARLVYWSDFKCASCIAFESKVLPDIAAKYVASGKVQIVYKDLPTIDPDSNIAALYGRAVYELYPGRYFAWRSAMVAAEGTPSFGDEASIVALTEGITGIDIDRLGKTLIEKRNEYQDAINADIAEAAHFGATAAPALLTGKKLIIGPSTYADVSRAIDAQL